MRAVTKPDRFCRSAFKRNLLLGDPEPDYGPAGTVTARYSPREIAALSDDPSEMSTHDICVCNWCVFGDYDVDDGWRDREAQYAPLTRAEYRALKSPTEWRNGGKFTHHYSSVHQPLTVPFWQAAR